MKLEINVPDSLHDVKLWQAQKYYNIYEQHKDSENASEFLDKKLVQIFCDVPLKVVNTIRKKDFDAIVLHLKEVLNTESDFVNTFELHGRQFGFIPDLDNITAGEYADLENYLTDVNTYHKAMAVCYRPIKKTLLQRLFKTKVKKEYLIQEYNGTSLYSDAMKDMPYSIVLGAIFFFWNLKIELLTYTLRYLREQVENQKIDGLARSGGGNKHLIRSLEVVTLKLNELRARGFTGYLIT